MEKIVVKKEDALKRVFKGVSLDSLAVGEKSMVTKMNYIKGLYRYCPWMGVGTANSNILVQRKR